MKLPVLLLVAMLASIIPFHAPPAIATQAFSPGGGQSALTYNFSSLPAGSIPANSSWISFGMSGSNNISYSIQSYGGVNGLNIRTDSYTLDSYLNMSVSVPAGYSITVNFSWSDQQNGAFTEDNLLFGNASASLCTDVRFGPYNGFHTQIIHNSSVLYQEGDLPFSSDVISLDQVNFPNSMEYCILSPVSEDSFPAPLSVQALSGKLFFSVGGEISNLTIYSISLQKEDSFPFSTAQVDGHPVYSSIPAYLRTVADWNSSIVMPGINSIFIPCYNGTLFDFNYENMTFFRLASAPLHDPGYNFIGSFHHGGSACFLFSWTGGTYLISLWENLSYIMYYYSGSLDTTSVVFGTNGNFSAFNTMGIQHFSYSFKPEGNTSLPSFLRNYTLLATRMESGRFTAFLTDFSSGYKLTVDQSGAINLTADLFPKAQFSGIVSLVSTTVSNSNSTSVLAIAENNSALDSRILDDAGLLYFPSQGMAAAFPGMEILASSVGMVNLGSGKFINITMNSQPINSVFGDNGSGTLCVVAGTVIYVLNAGLPTPIRGSLSFRSPGNLLLRGNSTIDVPVNSTSPFTSTLSIDGRIFTSNSPLVYANTSGIPSGNYTSVISVGNLQGFLQNASVLARVDHYSPLFTISAGNYSYVSNGSVIYYNITDPWMVKSLSASYDGDTLNLNSTGSLNLSGISMPEYLYLNFTATDCFGYEFHFNYVLKGEVISKENFTTSLRSGNISVSSENISWTNLSWAQYYIVKVGYADSIIHTNFTMLKLNEGTQAVSLYGVSFSGQTVLLRSALINVIDYPPLLNLVFPAITCYSFFGNSLNDSLAIDTWTNITSTIMVKVIHDGATLFSMKFPDSANLTFGPEDPVFSLNGNYTVLINATSPSGTFAVKSFFLLVNNTVPPEPELPQALYSNTTTLHMSLPGIYRYSVILTSGNYTGTQNFSTGNVSVLLPYIDERYTMTVRRYSDSGNSNYSSVEVLAYDLRPQISLTASSGALIASPVIHLAYSLSDPVPQATILLMENGRSVENLSAGSGNVAVRLESNGIYNFTVEARDLCGNFNMSTNVTVQNLYYSDVASASIGSFSMFSGWEFTADLEGVITPEVQVQWYVNGKYAGNSTVLSVNLPVGKSNIELVVLFDGRASVSRTAVENYGYLPLVAPASAFLCWIALFAFYGIRSDAQITALIMGSMGKPLKEVARKAARTGYNRLAFRRTLKWLKSHHRIAILDDPDGKLYVMEPWLNK